VASRIVVALAAGNAGSEYHRLPFADRLCLALDLHLRARRCRRLLLVLRHRRITFTLRRHLERGCKEN
jgi:hypothetical protein